MRRQRIRIIKKKRKTLKEKLLEFIKTAYGKKIVAAVGIILILLIVLSQVKSDPLRYMDYIGQGKRIDYLINETKALSSSNKKKIETEFNDGFCLFGVHRDTILFTELYGTSKSFAIDWSNTEFISKKEGLEIHLPTISNLDNGTKISSRKITLKNDDEYSFNSVNGTNLLLKAEKKLWTLWKSNNDWNSKEIKYLLN